MFSALASWYQHNLVLGTVATTVGLLVVAPLLISKRTRQWAKRLLDGDVEIIGIVVLVLAIISFAIYNNLSR